MLHLVKTAVQVAQIPYYSHAGGMQVNLDEQQVGIFSHLHECLIFHMNSAKRGIHSIPLKLTSEIVPESQTGLGGKGPFRPCSATLP